MDIDPRLRGPGDHSSHQQQPYDQHGRITQPFPATSAGPFNQNPHNPPTPGQNPQQHSYYAPPPPTSFGQVAAQSNPPGTPYNEEEDGNQGPTDPLNDLKRPRACENCRSLKVRCEFDEETGTCRRCAKAGRQCVITAPTRKRQKKTDSRVAELEKKIDALTQSLVAQNSNVGNAAVDPSLAQAQITELQQQKQTLNPDYASSSGNWGMSRSSAGSEQGRTHGPDSPDGQHAGMKRKLPPMSNEFPFVHNDGQLSGEAEHAKGHMSGVNVPMFSSAFKSWAPGAREVSDSSYVDVIDRQLIDLDSARRMFDKFVTKMAPQLPAVVFPLGTNADEIRKNKPVLFLSIMAAAAGFVAPQRQLDFTLEVVRIIADRVLCRGQKTLELVQALLVTSTWYQPPDRYEELNFNQLIHMSAVMGIDLGMGKRSRPGPSPGMWKEYNDKRKAGFDPDGAETRRTWLGCYFMCAK
ncbi:MAG: hypothetical protein Q9227_000198 [Pyrenula ochraceoflavens]